MKIAFIITCKRNNVVVSFGTLKVQSFMLTEVRDCDLLIVVTSSTFLKRKDILKEKRCMHMHVHTYAQMEGPGGGASACWAVSWVRVRTHVHVHACARVYAWGRMCTACSECYMHFETGVLGTSA